MKRTHRRRNSAQHRIRHYTRFLVNQHSYRDKERAENVNSLSSIELLVEVAEKFDEIPVGEVLFVEKGEVIEDARGEGNFQKKP